MPKPGGVFLGLDWMRQDGLSSSEIDRWIEPIGRQHGAPDLVTLGEFRTHLDRAGFVVDRLEDAARQGNILRNWELLDEKTIAGIRDLPADAIPPALRWVTDGGIALAEVARSGAFLIGYWRAASAGPEPCRPSAL